VRVLIDGIDVGTPGGWTSRSDLTALFSAASYPGISHAAAAFTFDTTTLPNGLHTIAWTVTATAGGTAGVGSRFFSVSNGSSLLRAPSRRAASVAAPTAAEIESAPLDNGQLMGRLGFDRDTPLETFPFDSGRTIVQGDELSRVELHLDGAGYTGYVRAGSQ